VPSAGLTEAGSIVVLLAFGVSIANADWREPVGEGGGETSCSAVAVSISSPVVGGGTTSVATVERLGGGGDGGFRNPYSWQYDYPHSWCNGAVRKSNRHEQPEDVLYLHGIRQFQAVSMGSDSGLDLVGSMTFVIQLS